MNKIKILNTPLICNSSVKTELMRFFVENPLRCFPIDTIISKTRLSQELAIKAMVELNDEGVTIGYRPDYGYYYDPNEFHLHPDLIASHLPTRWWGRRIIVGDSVSSTIALAKTLTNDHAVHGTVVLANAQMKGRGRYGNAWISSKGKDILLTFLVSDIEWYPPASLLSLYAATSVVLVLDTAYSLPVSLKWPNDIISNGLKIGGVLIDRDKNNNSLLISLGLNVHSQPKDWPNDIRKKAASLISLKKESWHRDMLIAQCGTTWETQWEIMMRDKGETIRDYWNRYSTTLGKTVSICCKGKEIKGFTKNIDREGRLILVKENGAILNLLPEEVQWLRILH